MLIQQIRSLGSLCSETGRRVFPNEERRAEGSFRAPTYWKADLINHHYGRAGLDFIGFLAEINESEKTRWRAISQGEIEGEIQPCLVPIKSASA
jgi:hypothetical protein